MAGWQRAQTVYHSIAHSQLEITTPLGKRTWIKLGQGDTHLSQRRDRRGTYISDMREGGLGLVMDQNEMVIKRTAGGFLEPVDCSVVRTLWSHQGFLIHEREWFGVNMVAQHKKAWRIAQYLLPLMLAVSCRPMLQKVCESMGLFKVLL